MADEAERTRTHKTLTGETGASFSACERYRYKLWRTWDNGPWLNFVMLNPSTADERDNDPTVERCQVRATKLGFGSFAVANIFAYRSTQPNVLTLPTVVPIGEGNDEWIQFTARTAAKVMIGWGNHGKFMNRSENVIAMLEEDGLQLFCLDQNKGGCPVHPLYQAYEKPLRRYMQSVI